MGLFDKKKEAKPRKQGSIPKGLGIKQERADEIIEAVRDSYLSKHHGDVNKVFADIKSEKLKENEAIFAYYVVGCVKISTDHKMERLEGGLDGLESLLEKLFEGK